VTVLAPPPAPKAFHQAHPIPRFFAGLLVGFLGRLSRPALARLGRWVGSLVWALGIRRAVTLENLERALPELPAPERRAIARRAYQNLAWGVLESLTSSEADGGELGKLVTIDNWELVEQQRARGKGLLIATGHFGSWELLGEAMAQRLPISVVVKPLKGALNERMVRSRLEAGIELLAGRGAVASSVEALGRGRVVCMLVDQVISAERGVFVPFFGQLASTTPGLSVAAARSGAPVLVGMGVRDGVGLRLTFEGPIDYVDTGDPAEDVRRHTAEITAALERWIRRHPDHWLWLHRRWKVRPPQGQGVTAQALPAAAGEGSGRASARPPR
jgi:Kdo2-lipid IVA lauroyltransferase/acyltransferase